MSSLYLHVPFCRRKCPYCDFFSVADRPDFLENYPDLLCRHLALAAAGGGWKGPLETIFFGGGTPSLLAPAGIGHVLETAARLFGLAAEAEISLEANPGTVSPESLAGYRAAGVNRLSFGIQSFQPRHLRQLGRGHTPEQARQAFGWARQAGFVNLGGDLMFALPGQTPEDLRADLAAFLDLGPEHLSCYGLTIEEQTPFHHLHRAGGLQMPEEDFYRACYLELHHTLQGAGYRHYEIANYARPGWECRHNLGYWQRRPYLGIGAGAHSLLAAGWGERQAVPPDLERFRSLLLQGSDPAEVLETFDRRGAMGETLYLGLRTAEGVSEDEFRNRFGAGPAEAYPGAIQRAADRLHFCQGRWRLDLDGWLLFDHLIAHFL